MLGLALTKCLSRLPAELHARFDGRRMWPAVAQRRVGQQAAQVVDPPAAHADDQRGGGGPDGTLHRDRVQQEDAQGPPVLVQPHLQIARHGNKGQWSS